MLDDCVNFLKEKAKTDVVFFNHWYDFHFGIEKYVTKNACSSIAIKYPDAAWAALINCPTERASLRELLLRSCNLSKELDYDISSAVLPYAMLSPKVIEKLILILGAFVCYKDISKIVGRQYLEKICGLIGRDVHIFIIKRSLLFWKKIPIFDSSYSKLPLKDRIKLYGQKIMEYVIHGLPVSVISRLNLRTGIKFAANVQVEESNFSRAVELTKYAIVNFFADDEGAKLCLR